MTQIIDSLNWRYATKDFDANKKISADDLHTITESFRLTASSFGLQPWKLIVVENQEIKDSLVEHSWGQKQIADCSQLLVFCARDNFDETDVDAFVKDIKETRGVSQEDIQWYEDLMKGFLAKMDENQINTWVEKQVYIALWNVMTACAELKIDSCPIEWFIPSKYDEILWLKEKWIHSVVALPVWYRSSDDVYADLEKVRFNEDTIIETI